MERSDDLDRVRQQVRAWRDELIDLSRRNRLINFRQTKSSSLAIVEPDAQAILDRLGQGWRFHYPDLTDQEAADTALVLAIEAEESDPTHLLAADELRAAGATAGDLSRILHNLHRKASSEYIDKGLRVLYLGIGMLTWSDSEADDLKSPLVLVPVSLERASPRDPYRLMGTDDDAVINPALRVKLELEFNVVLPEFVDLDDLDSAIAEIRLAIHEHSRWRVTDEIVLSTFSFQKEAMYQDLKDNEDTICEHDVVRALSGDDDAVATSTTVGGFEPADEAHLDESVPPEASAAILDADSTQRQCIAAAVDGRTFLIHGPPGSGKSQTIANTIAELLAANKTVLFVSEKAAALDVVKSRLDASGLGHYVLELHSHKATRKEVAQDLGWSLETRPQAAKSMTSEELAGVKQRRRSLSAYATALNEIREPLGLSLQQVLGRLVKLASLPRSPIPDGITRHLSRAELEQIRAAATDWASAWDPIQRGTDFLWRDLDDAASVQRRINATGQDLDRLIGLVSGIEELGASAATELMAPLPRSMDDAARLGVLIDLLAQRPDVPGIWLTGDLELVDRRQLYVASLWKEYERAVAEMERLAGRDCTDLDPSSAVALDAALDQLSGAEPPLKFQADLDHDRARSLAAALLERSALANSIREAAVQLADDLGLGLGEPDLTRTRAVAEAAQLAASDHRPEASWLDAEGLKAAQKAVKVLEPLVQQYRELTSTVEEHFKPEVASLDIESFYNGPNDLVPNLSRLSAEGRTNRKQLKACTRSGKLSKDIVARVATIRQWRATVADLAVKEADSAAPIGEHYYRQTETDFDAVNEAITVAERALALLGAISKGEALNEALSLSSSTPAELANRGRALAAQLEVWQEPLPADLEDSSDPLAQWSFSEACEWFETQSQAVERLASELDKICAPPGPNHLEIAHRIAELRRDTVALADELESARGEDAQVLGPEYAGAATDWGQWQASRDWAGEFRNALGGALEEHRVDAVLGAMVSDVQLTALVDQIEKRQELILTQFQPEYQQALADDLAGSFEDQIELLTMLRDQTGEVDIWITYTSARRQLVESGLGATVEFCESEAAKQSEVVGIFEAATLTAVADDILATDERCRPMRSEERDRLVAEYRELDRQLVAHAASRVIDVCNRKRPRQLVGEASVIQKESAKKTRHRPIKQLLGDAGRVAQNLRPCFMMSPLSVSQFLPPQLRFDVVIFDEASQVRPCDAVNAVYRGDQLIVAGDDKQLPPTSFFARGVDDGDDEYAEEDLDVFESVLDLARSSGSIPTLPLRWHYRSRHESLITYSNRAFYGGKLISYPGATDQGEDVGLHLVHVPDGEYRRGEGRDNPVEARKVVERIFFHATHHPDTSLGVVAFSEAQATRIGYELEAARRERPDLDQYFAEDRLGGFFIKNLESVQGDERDIILFSIGYGRDESGKLTMNFGPLNREGGHRRLNVAITRARQRVEVITSITSGDFADTANVGVNHLRRYLDFAQRGVAALTADDVDPTAEAESPFEEAVLDVIRELGYVAVPQVGQAGYRIDIGIRDPEKPGRYVIGIECDGAAYHSSRVARDRDRLRQEVLEGLGWRLHRIWGPSWYRDLPGETARLKLALEAAVRGDLEPLPTKKTAQPVEVELEDVDLNGTPDWSVPYEAADLGYSGKEITDPLRVQALRESIREVVAHEGPVSEDIISARIRRGWSNVRNSAKVRVTLHEAIQSLVSQGSLLRTDDGFLYLGPAQLERVRHAVAGDAATIRKAGDVSLNEIALALKLVLEEARSATEDELTVRVARIFGWGRRGSDISSVLSAALRSLTTEGHVSRLPDGRYAYQP